MPSNHSIRFGALAAAAVLTASLAACAAPADSSTPAPSESSSSTALQTVTEGKLTIATGEPAYFPYVIDDDPSNGQGFESAVAYAVAANLGFAAEDVVWIRSTFDEAIAPGPKAYDFNLQQVSITDERKSAVDFSSPYYAAQQAVITVEGSAAASATSIADLAKLKIGAATATTSLTAIEEIIAPESGAQIFNSNDDAKLALESGQVDAIIVDLPTAYYITGVELDGGVIVGTLPDVAGDADEWGLVLAKGSPITAAVTKAVDTLTADGTLAAIVEDWLGAGQGVPELQ